MIISTKNNIASQIARRQLEKSTNMLSVTAEKLSTGNRINRAKDDPQGLAIADNLNAQVRTYKYSMRNAEDGISIMQIKEGSLDQIGTMITRMYELATQAANDSINDQQRLVAQEEFQALQNEIDRLANSTVFNDHQLLNDDAVDLPIQIGIFNNAEDSIVVQGRSATARALGISSNASYPNQFASINTKLDAQKAMDKIILAIEKVTDIRGNIGATQNRMESSIQNIAVNIENLSSSESRIRNADFALQSANLTQFSMLQQAGVSMLAQANQLPQMALQLLRG